MRLLRDFRWLLVLTLAAIALPLVLFVAAKTPAAPVVRAGATPTLVALAEPTAIPEPTIMATARPKDTATAQPTATRVPTAVSTATPLPTEAARPEPASRGGARVETEPTETPAVAPAPVTPRPTPTTAPPSPPPSPTRVVAALQPAVGSEITYSLDLLNRARVAAGLPALQLDVNISTAARGHAEEMAANDYLAHVNKQGQQPWDRMRAAGVQFGYAAENLGRAWADKGPAEPAIKQMHDMMMAETPPNDGHLVNILSPKARRVGIGVARVNGWVYWVCDFAD
ncbi:MAG: CAP domain-containing protein [Chloroflexota bacterium]